MQKFARFFWLMALCTSSVLAQDRYFDLGMCSNQATTDLLAIQSAGAKVGKSEDLPFNSTRLTVEGYRFSDEHVIDMRLTFYKGRLMEIYIPVHDPNWHSRLFMGGFANFLSDAMFKKYMAPTQTVFNVKGGVDARQWRIANGKVLLTHQLNQYDNTGREDKFKIEYFTYACSELVEVRAGEMTELRLHEGLQREQMIRETAKKF